MARVVSECIKEGDRERESLREHGLMHACLHVCIKVPVIAGYKRILPSCQAPSAGCQSL